MEIVSGARVDGPAVWRVPRWVTLLVTALAMPQSIRPDQDCARLANAVGLEKRFGRSVTVRTDVMDIEVKFGRQLSTGI
jgi:hypothetical protein